MAVPSGTTLISRALVVTLKGNANLKTALTGGMHEGLAPDGTKYPFLVYNLHYGSIQAGWGFADVVAGYDVFVYSRDQVEARNLDQLVHETLWDAALNVTGQSTLYCRRSLEMSSVDVDEQGQKVYQVGGLYVISTYQTL